ncbi:bifunctional DNA primase/polymerase [Streptomyces collinus]|uniref:bifunctional DNA primase/polymerase n=1 Tax=Streptomyces collinus TaxID=42684 RepID=UPI0036CD5AF6
MSRQVATGSPAPFRPREVARWCAAKGWPVHPLAPGKKTPPANCALCRAERHAPTSCPCLSAGGHCHSFHAATTSLDFIDTWWSKNPAFGVAVSCGPANLIVIDVDSHGAVVPDRSRLLPGISIGPQVTLTGLTTGFDTLALLAALHYQPNPVEDSANFRVRTPSGGMHIWYRNPKPSTRYRSTTGSSSKAALAWQVDVRSDGGYIVAPTTRTSLGSYHCVGAVRDPAPLPEWLAMELMRTGHVSSKNVVSPPREGAPSGVKLRTHTAQSMRILHSIVSEVAACAALPDGASFTEKLNRAAYTAGGLVQGGYFSEAQAREFLEEAARYARPHQERRNIGIIESALSVGAQRPFHPRGRS